MAKGSILSDTFEQLVELGQSTAKKTVKSVAQTLNPFDKTSETQSTKHPKYPESPKNPNNHKPLDFQKLKNKFQDKDKLQAEALRNRLFQIVKREDEKSLERKKMEEADKKRREEYLAQEKKRKEQEKQQQEQQGNIPRGKIRRSIFSSKKVAERQHAEFKPATGKQ
ncbi:MAG: hypothetical protein Q7U68_04760 [Candidatus Roizmanbacteria bacterium]|nr:hypothetical protein [Candidatus Roizmanbacteria bacterium]